MNEQKENQVNPPSLGELSKAVETFIRVAYGDCPPVHLQRFRPPPGCDPEEWLMSDEAERHPDDVPFKQVRSFALRIGNAHYPHMKLRLSRPPNDSRFVYTVDAHDAMLKAPVGSADYEALEHLKKNNAEIAAEIVKAWEEAGLLTEHSYLRDKIRQGRED
jgi:hypothetical protein